MKHPKFLLLIFSILSVFYTYAQETLPDITVKNFNGRIIVSWQNSYKLPVSNILIQRSYDSLKNYTTIGSVLNPQNKENGYADLTPPYNKMYYRVSVSFDGGSYIITPPVRPVKDITVMDSLSNANDTRYPWQIKPDSLKNEITFPSQRIFTASDNNLVIHLRDAPVKKYSAKFYDELNNFLFELTKLTEEYLIVEKVNFVHAGWFYFEIYESSRLIEKNKFFIASDGKNGDLDNQKKTGNK